MSMNNMKTNEQKELYRAKLNLETGHIAWRELQRFFASGVAMVVSPELDLVEVAWQIAEDNAVQIAAWMQTAQLGNVSDEQALTWYAADAQLWAVVVNPYVLVQDK
jgi:hypothetical protein